MPAIADRLFEDPILVTQPVPHGRQLHRRHRIEKARRKPPKPAIAEPGIGLLLECRKSVDIVVVDETPRHLVRSVSGRRTLIGIERHDLTRRRHALAVEEVRHQEVFEDIVGVRTEAEDRVNGGNAGPSGRLGRP